MKNVLTKILLILFALSIAVSAMCFVMANKEAKTSLEVNVIETDNSVQTFKKENLQNGQSCFEKSEFDTPEYFIKGLKYTLDNVFLYTNNNGSVSKKVMTAALISEDGGEYKSFDYRDFEVTADKTIQIKYKDGAIEEETEVVPVISNAYDAEKTKFAEKYLLQNYFVGENATVNNKLKTEIKSNSILYKLEDASGNATLDYINALSLNAFNIEFLIPEKYDNFSYIDIQLLDYYTKEVKNFIRISDMGSGTNLTSVLFNGSEKILAYNKSISREFTGTSSIKFDYSNGCIVEKSGLSFRIHESNAYVSDRILLHINFYGITGDVGIEIKSVNKQSFGSGANATNGTINVDNSNIGSYQNGTKIVVYKPVIGSAVCPFYSGKYNNQATYKISVKINSQVVYSVDGVKLDFTDSWSFEKDSYEFELTKLGKYVVEYSYKDQNGKSAKGTTTLNYICIDRQPPEYKLISNGVEYTSNTVLNVKKGETMTLPTVVATDDFDSMSNMTIYISVYRPDTYIDIVSNSTYKFTSKGEYTVVFEVIDSAGNYTPKMFKVIVG